MIFVEEDFEMANGVKNIELPKDEQLEETHTKFLLITARIPIFL